MDPFLTAEPTHLRVGWASSSGYAPYPGGGEGWGGNGVGNDLYSYGFDGLHLWSGEFLGNSSAPYLLLGMIELKLFKLKWSFSIEMITQESQQINWLDLK